MKIRVNDIDTKVVDRFDAFLASFSSAKTKYCCVMKIGKTIQKPYYRYNNLFAIQKSRMKATTPALIKCL